METMILVRLPGVRVKSLPYRYLLQSPASSPISHLVLLLEMKEITRRPVGHDLL